MRRWLDSLQEDREQPRAMRKQIKDGLAISGSLWYLILMVVATALGAMNSLVNMSDILARNRMLSSPLQLLNDHEISLLLLGLICALALILLLTSSAMQWIVKTFKGLKVTARILIRFLLSVALGILISYAWGSVVRSLGSSVRITAPRQGESAVYQRQVTGTVLNPTTDVWVVVHPMATGGFFVQPRVGVRPDLTWSVIVFFGSGPSTGAAQGFEVGAFANPKVRLAEGQVLNDWPDAESRDIVGVIRR